MLLAVSRSFYCLDLLIVNSFPSVTIWEAKPKQSFFYILWNGLKMISSILLVIAELLTYDRHRVKFICATTALIATSYCGISFTFLRFTKSSISMILLQFILTLSWIVYCLGIGLQLYTSDDDNHNSNNGRFWYGKDFQTGAMAIGFLTYMILLFSHYHYINIYHILEQGNYLFLSYLFGFSGCFAIFLYSLAVNMHKSGDECQIACHGTLQLGYMMIAVSSLMEFFYSIIVHDVALIHHYEEFSWLEILSDCFSFVLSAICAPFSSSGRFTGDDSLLKVQSQHQHHHYQRIVNEEKEEIAKEDEIWINEGLQESTLLQDYLSLSSSSSASAASPVSFGASAEMKDDDFTTTATASSAFVEEVDVLIVGCGPTGLTLANELGIRGIRTKVIDTRLKPTTDARFFNLSCPTIEGLKRLNLKDDISKKAIPGHFGHGTVASTGLLHDDSTLIGATHGPCRDEQVRLGHSLPDSIASRVTGSRYAEEPVFRIMQSHQETVLKQHAEQYDCNSVNYGYEMIDFVIDKTSSTTSPYVISRIKNVNDPTKTQIVRSKYLVGCDGPASFVSRKIHAKFDGFVNLGQTRTIHIRSLELVEKVRNKLGDVLQYHVVRPGYGVGFFVLNDFYEGLWTFFLFGLVDGRMPRQIATEEIPGICKEFIGGDVSFEIVYDTSW
jgi:hypothetical protein